MIRNQELEIRNWKFMLLNKLKTGNNKTWGKFLNKNLKKS